MDSCRQLSDGSGRCRGFPGRARVPPSTATATRFPSAGSPAPPFLFRPLPRPFPSPRLLCPPAAGHRCSRPRAALPNFLRPPRRPCKAIVRAAASHGPARCRGFAEEVPSPSMADLNGARADTAPASQEHRSSHGSCLSSQSQPHVPCTQLRPPFYPRARRNIPPAHRPPVKSPLRGPHPEPDSQSACTSPPQRHHARCTAWSRPGVSGVVVYLA